MKKISGLSRTSNADVNPSRLSNQIVGWELDTLKKTGRFNVPEDNIYDPKMERTLKHEETINTAETPGPEASTAQQANEDSRTSYKYSPPLSMLC